MQADISLAQGWMMTLMGERISVDDLSILKSKIYEAVWILYRMLYPHCFSRFVLLPDDRSNDTISISSYITPKTSAAYCYALFGKWFTSWYTVWPRIIPQNTQYTIRCLYKHMHIYITTWSRYTREKRIQETESVWCPCTFCARNGRRAHRFLSKELIWYTEKKKTLPFGECFSENNIFLFWCFSWLGLFLFCCLLFSAFAFSALLFWSSSFSALQLPWCHRALLLFLNASGFVSEIVLRRRRFWTRPRESTTRLSFLCSLRCAVRCDTDSEECYICTSENQCRLFTNVLAHYLLFFMLHSIKMRN